MIALLLCCNFGSGFCNSYFSKPSIKIEAYIFSPEHETSIEGFVSAASDDIALADSQLTLNFIQDYIPPPEEEDLPPPVEKEEPPPSYGKTIAIILIVLVIIIVAWFYFKKFKKSKLKPDLMKRALPSKMQ